MANEDANQAGAFTLSAAEIEKFDQQGFLGPFTALPPEALAAQRCMLFDNVLQTPCRYSSYRTELRHLDSVTVWRLCTLPAIVGRLASLYGRDLMLWYSNLFDKGHERPELQGAYPWHQDELPFEEQPMSTLSAWLAITPATPANGCVEIIPGSHTRVVPIQKQIDPGVAGWFAGREADRSCFNEADRVPMILQPGEFFLFDGRVLHRSNPNRTPERRLGLSFRVTLPSLKLGLDHPCIMASGADRHGVNALVVPPTGDPAPTDRPEVPDSANYQFDRPLYGLGWHLLERDGATWFRWTGPEKDSWLDLAWRGIGPGRLRCRVLHAMSPAILRSLQIHVNGQPVALRFHAQEPGCEVEAFVADKLLQAGQGRVRISFHVNGTRRPCDCQPNNTDTRSLGLAIGDPSLAPLEGMTVKPHRWQVLERWRKR